VIVVVLVVVTLGARQAIRAIVASSASISVLEARIPNISYFYYYSLALASTRAALAASISAYDKTGASTVVVVEVATVVETDVVYLKLNTLR